MRHVRVLQKETWRGNQLSHIHILVIAKKKKKVRKYMFLTFDNTFSDGKCCIFICFFINKYHRRIKTHPYKFYHLPSNIFINFASPTATLTSQNGDEVKITSFIFERWGWLTDTHTYCMEYRELLFLILNR